MIGLQSYRIRWKKTQNKGYYAIQGHRGRHQSKSYRFGVIAAYCSNFGHFAFLRPPLGDLRATYNDHLRLIGKRVMDFLLVLTELFSLGVTAEELRANIG